MKIDRRGRPKIRDESDSKYELCRILLHKNIKRDLERKANNRNLKLSQLIRIILKYYNSQSTIETKFKKKIQRTLENAEIVVFRLEPDLKAEILKKAHSRNMYFSELVRDVLDESNKQISETPGAII